MSLQLVEKSVTLNDLERRNGPYFALFFLPNLVISGSYCVKVFDKAITMDNLRLLCLVTTVYRGTARRPRYKFLADWWIQDLMRSTCLAMVLLRSRIWAFDWYQYRWPWMTLNSKMALSLHYFTDFVYDVFVKQLLGLPWFHNLLLIVYDHINTICAISMRLFTQNKLWYCYSFWWA